MENVLDEVESLFQKISSLPEDDKQIAISKIQERLARNISNAGSKLPDATESESSMTSSIDFCNQGEESPKATEAKTVPRKLNAKSRRTSKSGGIGESTSTRGTKRIPAKVVHVNLHPTLETTPEQSDILDDCAVTLNSEVLLEDGVSFVEVLNEKKVFQCDACSIWIEGRKNFKRHLKTHEPKLPYACPICEKTFTQSSNLSVHLKRHNNQRDFACKLCDYRSVTKMDLVRHLSVHNKKQDLICEFCAKAFSLKRSLYLHIRTVHNKDTVKYQCSECSFETHQKNNLKVHVRLRHLGDYYTHVCPVCDARVKLKSAFLEHLRAHTGDRPFACDLCTARFACVGRLNTHRRTIHAPRQFTCDICSKKFPTKYSLQRHENVHTNNKPHSCPFCSFACNMQGNLTKHIRNVHEQPDFSLRQFKQQQQANTRDKKPRDKKKWTEEGQKAFNQYLTDFSEQLGRQVTVNELKAQEEERRKMQVAAKEKAKIERINRITSKEHSYFLKPDSPPPSSPGILPLPSNIYLEAIAAANLDFSTANLVESIPIPDLGDPTGRMFSLQPGIRLMPPISTLEYSDFNIPSHTYILPDGSDDKLSMDPMLSTYSEVLQVPSSLGLDSLNNPSLIDGPNVYVQLPSGEKLQWNLNSMRDSQLIDSVEQNSLQQAPLAQVEGLRDYLPSVMIVVGESMDQQIDPPS